MKTTKKQFRHLLQEIVTEVLSETEQSTNEGPSAIKPILVSVKSIIDKNRSKNNLKAFVNTYKGKPYLEIRAYGRLKAAVGHGAMGGPELEDDYFSLLEQISKLIGDGPIELDQMDDYSYALFDLERLGSASKLALKEHLASVCPTTKTTNEGKHEDFLAATKPTNPDVKKFAQDILEKIKDRQRKKGFSDMNIGEAIRQMIEFKLTKEGWRRTQPEEDSWPVSPESDTAKKIRGDVSAAAALTPSYKKTKSSQK